MPDNSTAVPAAADGPDRQVFAHWDLVNMVARKHFRAEHLVIESADFVLQRLEENNWERVRKHTGRGSVRAYLSRVIQRLLSSAAHGTRGPNNVANNAWGAKSINVNVIPLVSP